MPRKARIAPAARCDGATLPTWSEINLRRPNAPERHRTSSTVPAIPALAASPPDLRRNWRTPLAYPIASRGPRRVQAPPRMLANSARTARHQPCHFAPSRHQMATSAPLTPPPAPAMRPGLGAAPHGIEWVQLADTRAAGMPRDRATAPTGIRNTPDGERKHHFQLQLAPG